jgi:small subunit ribosomal protein S16
MSVRIRLQRIGSHKKPFYRIVAIDSRNKRDGKFLEILGIYEPLKNITNIDFLKVNKWLSLGVQTTPTVKNLLKKIIKK